MMLVRDDVPTRDEILNAIRSFNPGGTLCSILRSKLEETYPDLTTACVRKRLLEMEAAGFVERASTSFARQISWAITASAPQGELST